MISYVTRIFSLLCLLETGVMGDARLCTFEINGETRYLVCPRNEYCCKLGCCLSPSFQFYQLWYYWLMVIFMLVVCSGGQWWYKYWVEGERSGGPPTVMVRGGGNTSSTQPTPRPRMGVVASTSTPTTASTSSSLPTSFTLIHQICKPHHYHTRGGEGKVPSPYDQIYGPPPSYESVFGGQPSSVLPAYTISPEPPSGSSQRSGGGDPLGAVEHAPLRGHCPSYSQSQLDQCDTQRNNSESSSTVAVQPSPSHSSDSVPQEGNSNCDSAPRHEDETTNHVTTVNTIDETTHGVSDTASTSQIESMPASTTDSQVQTHRPSQCLEHLQH